MKVFKFRTIAAVAAVAAASLAPQFAAAESDVVTGAGGGDATARLNFRVTIPRVLFLQVGTGTSFVDDNTEDRIEFSPTATEVVNLTANRPGTGGDLTNGAVSVRVFANSGNVNLAADGAASGMQSSTVPTDFIPWTQLTATPAAGTADAIFAAASIAHPVINGADATLTPTAGVIKQVGRWTFTYNNSASYAPGEYNGEVTYTASAP